ncbi:hypothetical protein AA0113_g10581 [Alternaria arborescens]|uniref:Uncharacterized protein n=1 Tax=Alternaria arborescens TaxID=156630 RepID=A0A4Q4QNQ4_9PLEO|nr:hypothetical protein AA0113_g10581 [Alternaria arborescens]
MASGTKKRRRSQSPVHGIAPKRARVLPTSTSTSLPTGEDWLFRVKVISSAKDLNNELFKNAVQGLVRICFPEGVLDQLGSQILEQHMREEMAPENNIRKMAEIFRTEMTQRVASLLAEHLDTVTKVETMVQATIVASVKLHGSDLGGDILGHMIASLLQLKAKASENPTDLLTKIGDPQEKVGSDEDMGTIDVSDVDSPTSEKKRKRERRTKKTKRRRTPVKDGTPKNANMDFYSAALPTERRVSTNKDKKISSKWQWNIDETQLADDDVADAFPRTSSLFAYHALPIAKRKLGSQASRKELRCEMQSLLDGMPPDEFEKWLGSLQKLLNGDREMLTRQDVATSSVDRQLSRATPAPVDLRMKARIDKKTKPGEFGRLRGRAIHVENDYEEAFVKCETAERSVKVGENSQINHIAEATKVFRHLSTEEHELDRPLPRVEVAERQRVQHLKSSENIDSTFGMPVLSLLWGSDSLTATECMNDSTRITQTIMSNIKHRISAEVDYRHPIVVITANPPQRVVVSSLGGMNKTRTTSELQNAIALAFPKPGEHYGFMRIKKDIETALIPWVIAEPSAFPELKAMPFVFAHSVPSVPAVLNILFGSWSSVARLGGSELWDSILQALQTRGISEVGISF